MKELVIDISRWNDDVNLKAWVERRNLWGVVIKCGGHEEGLGRYKDPRFESHYKEAREAGLHIGFYYYTNVTDVNEAKLDAEHMIGLIGDKFYDLPWYMDVEEPCQYKLGREPLTRVIQSFCDTLLAAGHYSGLYTGGYAWLNYMYPDELRKYADWIAWWQNNWPSKAGEIGMWQQGGIRLSDGHIIFDDLSGYRDCDWCVVDYPSIIQNGSSLQADGNSMECLISIDTKDTVVWFDGVNINDLTEPACIDVIDKLHICCNGVKMPFVALSGEEFAHLCQAIKGTYPKHLKEIVDKYSTRSPE